MNNQKRKKKTMKIICEVFLELLKDISYNDISIKLICNYAEIHNTTFYKYYENKLDLAENVFKEYFIKDFIDLTIFTGKENISLKNLISFYSNNSIQLLETIDKHLNLIEIIFVDNDLKFIFNNSIKSYIFNFLNNEFHIHDMKLEILSKFISDFHVFYINERLNNKNTTIKDLEEKIKLSYDTEIYL